MHFHAPKRPRQQPKWMLDPSFSLHGAAFQIRDRLDDRLAKQSWTRILLDAGVSLQASGEGCVRTLWLPSYTAAYTTNCPALAGLACNSPVMVAELGKVRKKPTKVGQMRGYSYPLTGFPVNYQIGGAVTADSRLPNAEAACSVLNSRSVKPQANPPMTTTPTSPCYPLHHRTALRSRSRVVCNHFHLKKRVTSLVLFVDHKLNTASID